MSKYTDDELERIIRKAAEDAVGFYYEKTKHDFDLIMEALDSMKEQHDKKVDKDEFHESESDVTTLKLALTDTNKDLKSHGKRITKLEKTIYHA